MKGSEILNVFEDIEMAEYYANRVGGQIVTN